jgi:hypothetical protein
VVASVAQVEVEIMELLDWGTIGLGVIALALFLDRLAEETDEDTPIIGKYHGLIGPVAKALLSVLPGRKK